VIEKINMPTLYQTFCPDIEQKSKEDLNNLSQSFRKYTFTATYLLEIRSGTEIEHCPLIN
jgi:hypothetical protein